MRTKSWKPLRLRWRVVSRIFLISSARIGQRRRSTFLSVAAGKKPRQVTGGVSRLEGAAGRVIRRRLHPAPAECAARGSTSLAGELHTSHIPPNIAALTAYHTPRPSPLAPCLPPIQAADTPSLTPQSTSHASLMTPLGPGHPNVGRRRTSWSSRWSRSRLRLRG
jgi:hypothetical protein